MRIYNTMSRQKEELVPMTPGELKIYACGPTVYNYIHIGNARPICVFDVLRRYFNYGSVEKAGGETVYDYDASSTNRFAVLGDHLVVVLL